MIPIPKPSFLDSLKYIGFKDGGKRWTCAKGKRIFTWDNLHGEIEVFDRNGRHIGALDAVTGKQIKDAVRGRRIDV